MGIPCDRATDRGSAPTRGPSLCELHVHVGGCIQAEDILHLISGRETDWGPYEAAFIKAYDREPALRPLLAEIATGVPGARARFCEHFTFGDADAGDFDRFSAHFQLISCATSVSQRVLAGGFPPAVQEECRFLVGRIAAACRAQGIGHIEIRFLIGNPIPQAVRLAVYRFMLECFLAESHGGLVMRLTPTLPRDDPWPAWAAVRELALMDPGEALVGVDFCHVEEGHPPRGQLRLAQELRRFNLEHPQRSLALLYHVGESYRDKSVESAIRWCDEAATMLGTHRLGHAIALGIAPGHHGESVRIESVAERRDQIAYDLIHAEELRAHGVRVDPDALRREVSDLVAADSGAITEQGYDERRIAELGARQAFAIQRVRAAGAVAEVCPTSNRRIAGFTRPEVHPVHRFAQLKLPFVVASDDPGILGTTLADELAWIGTHAGHDDVALAQLAARAWECRSEVLAGRLAG